MIELLALASAVLYGSADFFGGLTARRANTIATVVWWQCSGLVLLLLALPFIPVATASSRACCRHDGCRRADHSRHRRDDSNPVRIRNRRTIATTHVCRRRARAARDLAREPSPVGAKGGHRFNAPRFSTGLRPRASFRNFRWHF